MSAIDTLLNCAGPEICPLVGDTSIFSDHGGIGESLAALLRRRNGFYAFDDALLVRPLHSEDHPIGLLEWNAPRLWKSEYRSPEKIGLCFAEDLFGNQHFLLDGSVWTFEPETAAAVRVGGTLEEWAGRIMADCDYLTARPLAVKLAKIHGALPRGKRLLPKLPFVTGGAFEIENMYCVSDLEGMGFRASISNQIAHIPDGESIIFRAK